MAICLREIRITNLCLKALGTYVGKCEGASWAGGRDCSSTALGTHTWLWEEHTSCRGWTHSTAQRPGLHRSSAPPSHTQGLLGFYVTASPCWDGADAGAFPSAEPTPAPISTATGNQQMPSPHFNLISGDGFVCLPNVPGLQLAGRAGQSHLQGTAQGCFNPLSPLTPDLPREKWHCMGYLWLCTLKDQDVSHRSRGGVLQTQTPPKF